MLTRIFIIEVKIICVDLFVQKSFDFRGEHYYLFIKNIQSTKIQNNKIVNLKLIAEETVYKDHKLMLKIIFVFRTIY